MNHTGAILLGAVLQVAPTARGSAPPEIPVISCDFRNEKLSRVLTTLAELTGRGILIHPDLTNLLGEPVSLRAEKIPLPGALGWVARQVDARAFADDGTFHLVREDPSLQDAPINTNYSLASFTEPDARKAFFEIAENALRAVKAANPKCRLELLPQNAQLVALLPPAGHRRLETLLEAFQGSPEEAFLMSTRAPELPAPLWQIPVTAVAETHHFLDITSRVADQMHINIGFDARRLRKGPYEVRLRSTPFMEALDVIVRQGGLVGYRYEPGNGIWLFGPGEKDAVFEAGCALWDDVRPAAFSLRTAAKRYPPDVIAGYIREHVAPASWSHPFTMLAIHDESRKLLVIHTPEVLHRIREILTRLDRIQAPDVPSVKNPVNPHGSIRKMEK
ncbi:MAG: hypothetical protein V1809_15995 [Planctomycetota bacterium]